MSDSQTPWHDPNSHPPGGCGAVLLVILGVLLLLPGACSLFFISHGLGNDLANLGLLISLGGLVLILFGAGLASKR
jgi:hypothetical protein